MEFENRSSLPGDSQVNYWGVNSIRKQGASVIFDGVSNKLNSRKRLLTELALVSGNMGLKVGIEAMSFVEASTTGSLRPLIERNPHAILMGVVIASGAWAGVSSLKFLKEEKVNNVSPNWLANRVYNRFSGPSRARDLVTAILPRFATIDLARIPIVWSSPELLSAMVVAKTMGILVGMGEVGALSVYKKMGRNKNKVEAIKEEEGIEQKAVIFQELVKPKKRLLLKKRALALFGLGTGSV